MSKLAAQTALTIQEAVERASSRYPAIKVSAEKASAAAAAVSLARTAYLPQLNAIAQVNRATLNNVYGMLLQQSVISPISGPPVPENRASNVFGTALGFLVSWEPFDFGLRQAGVDAAAATTRHAEAAEQRVRFEVAASTADSFLTVLAAQQQLQAAEAGVVRARTLYDSIHALAQAGLRPGADDARARAEVALAETQRIQADQAVRSAQAALGELLGEPRDVQLSGGKLLNPAPEAISTAASAHPAAVEQTAAIAEVEAREHVLARSNVPKFALQGTTYGRGTGVEPDAHVLGGANGLAPTFYNWGVGFTVTYNLTDRSVIGEKKRIEAANERAERAKLDQVLVELDARLRKARVALEGARQVAQVVPAQLDAARAAEQQASARYRSGLGTISDVAEAQRLLTSAEIDQAFAQLSVWRGLLAVAAAQGDLEAFLRLVR